MMSYFLGTANMDSSKAYYIPKLYSVERSWKVAQLIWTAFNVEVPDVPLASSLLTNIL